MIAGLEILFLAYSFQKFDVWDNSILEHLFFAVKRYNENLEGIHIWFTELTELVLNDSRFDFEHK
jgi:hypothetical protein